MPRIVSDTEREQTREAIYKATLTLISQKGLRKITVDDIVDSVGIGKGSFYAYYSSREVCIYQAVRRYEKEAFAKLETASLQKINSREQNEQMLREIFLSSSILFAISPVDMNALLRKLPPEYHEKEKQKVNNYFERCLELFHLEKENMEAVALLTDCINLVASSLQYTESGKKQAMDILITAIADLMSEGN